MEVPTLRPIAIRSYMVPDEEIRMRSTIEVRTNADLESNRLGITDVGKSCETCDNFQGSCPGHEGHMEMPIPLYRVLFIKRAAAIMNSVCFYCQRPRLPVRDPTFEKILSMAPEDRLDALEAASRKYKVCGQAYKGKGRAPKLTIPATDQLNALRAELGIEPLSEDDDSDDEEEKRPLAEVHCSRLSGACGMPAVRWDVEDSSFLRAVIPLTKEDKAASAEDDSWAPITIGPAQVYSCLKLLSASSQTLALLGCDGPWNQPSSLMWKALLVPSHNTRPSHSLHGFGNGKKKYNDWSKFLKDILKERNKLIEEMQDSSETVENCHYIMNGIESRDFRECFKHSDLKPSGRKAVQKLLKKSLNSPNWGPVTVRYRTLHQTVAAFHSRRHAKYLAKSNFGKPRTNVLDRYGSQKSGRIRLNIIARRINNAGRAVLEGYMYMPIDCVGIPLKEAMNLCVKVKVNRLNVTKLQRLILNGPHKHPGANYVTLKDGREISLRHFENRRDIRMDEVDTVSRHLVDGDLAMVGRQPTLHRASMMTFRVKVMNALVVRLHYAVFTPMAADCDGDEVNFYCGHTLESLAEVATLSTVHENICKDGKVQIKFIQNAVVGAYVLTQVRILRACLTQVCS